MAKSIFERLSGEYEQQEDYLIPRLTVPAEEEHSIGIWGHPEKAIWVKISSFGK